LLLKSKFEYMSTKKKLSIAIYIGRFQPLHKGHLATLKAALLEFDYLLVLVGSAQESRTCKNPWTYQERKDMLKHTLNAMQLKRVKILPLPDFDTDQEWLEYTNKLVTRSLARREIEKITTIGYTKDNSSYYLKLLPWPLKEFKDESFISISSTAIRQYYFNSNNLYRQELPEQIAFWIKQFELKHPRVFNRLKTMCK
jgi:bifunctional NMN adenylyltransferase/nudix hydrolase